VTYLEAQLCSITDRVEALLTHLCSSDAEKYPPGPAQHKRIKTAGAYCFMNRQPWFFGRALRRKTYVGFDRHVYSGTRQSRHAQIASAFAQTTRQATPLRVNAAGALLAPFQVPLKPGSELKDWPGGMEALYEALVMVTLLPL